MSIPNITERLKQGRQIHRQEYKAEDHKKLGFLRAGNSGVMNEQGQVAGACHRVAHLRSLGIEIDIPSDPTLIMFQLGVANEDVIYADLLHTSTPSEGLLRETEIPTSWFTSNGTQVTGRPDMVLTAKVGMVDEKSGAISYTHVPSHVIEIKSIASLWTTLEVAIKKKPKVAHLAQAAHYMWQLGNVTGTLLYKQYALQAMPDFAKFQFPRINRPGSELLEYNDKGEAKNVRPFEIGYSLRFNPDGQLEYAVEGTESWTVSVVSRQDVQRFYEFTSRITETGDLGSRPITIDPVGEEKKFSNCSYCPLTSICGKGGKKAPKLDYHDWLLQAKDLAGKAR